MVRAGLESVASGFQIRRSNPSATLPLRNPDAHVPLFLSGHPIGATGLAQCAELNWQVAIMPCPSLNHSVYSNSE